MSNIPYDADLTDLVAGHPGDWYRAVRQRCGLDDAPGSTPDTDLSGSLHPDSLFAWGDPPAAELQLELQSSTRPGYPAKLLR